MRRFVAAMVDFFTPEDDSRISAALALLLLVGGDLPSLAADLRRGRRQDAVATVAGEPEGVSLFKKLRAAWAWFWEPVEPLGNLPQGCLTVLGPFAGVLFFAYLLVAPAIAWVIRLFGGSP